MQLSVQRATLRAITLSVAALVAGSALAAAPSAASARPTSHEASAPAAASHTTARSRAASRHAHAVSSVIAEARKQKGKPYSYGAAGPHAFDCSGLVMYVYAHSVHKSLPHNAAEQFHATHRIWHHKNLQPGDLVFVDDGGYISHVGIFAGHGYWWVAPHSGTHVQKQKIYSAHLLYSRPLYQR